MVDGNRRWKLGNQEKAWKYTRRILQHDHSGTARLLVVCLVVTMESVCVDLAHQAPSEGLVCMAGGAVQIADMHTTSILLEDRCRQRPMDG